MVLGIACASEVGKVLFKQLYTAPTLCSRRIDQHKHFWDSYCIFLIVDLSFLSLCIDRIVKNPFLSKNEHELKLSYLFTLLISLTTTSLTLVSLFALHVSR